MTDHSYDLTALHGVCDDDEDIEELVDGKTYKEHRWIHLTHTPIKSPNPQRMKAQSDKKKEDESTAAAILHAVQTVTRKMDEQTKL